MKKVILKGTELELSNICYGTVNFGDRLDEKQAFAILDAFFDAGGNFVDTANVYGRWIPGLGNSSEQYIGKWLKTRKAYNKAVIATKGGHYDLANPSLSRINQASVTHDLEESLMTLGLDHMDFYWLHRDHPQVPVGEIIDMMEELVQAGKIRYYGASNYSLSRMQEAIAYAAGKGIRGFSAVSNQWSMASVNPAKNLNSDPSLVMLDDCFYQWHRETGMPLVPYSAGAQGFFEKLWQAGAQVRDGRLLTPAEELPLPEKLKAAYLHEKNLRLYEKLLAAREAYGASIYSLSIAGLLNHPFQVFPAASVSRPEQLESLLKASEIVLEEDFYSCVAEEL